MLSAQFYIPSSLAFLQERHQIARNISFRLAVDGGVTGHGELVANLAYGFLVLG